MNGLDILKKYIPDGAEHIVLHWLQPYSFTLRFKNPRDTKLGDYRIPRHGERHKITVNKNLSKELCFLTLTHEIAHLIVYETYKGKRIQPHGKEWKHIFGEMIVDSMKYYPSDLQQILLPFSKNPRAGFYSYKPLANYFVKHQNEGAITVEDVPMGKVFQLGNKSFKKIKKNKIRYLCEDIQSKRLYTVSPLAVINIQTDEK